MLRGMATDRDLDAYADDELVPARIAARFLGLHPDTMRQRTTLAAIPPASVTPGGMRRWSVGELREYRRRTAAAARRPPADTETPETEAETQPAAAVGAAA